MVEHVAAGLVENNQIAGAVKVFPEVGDSREALFSMPADTSRQKSPKWCSL